MRLLGGPSGLGCRVGPSVVAVGTHRGGTRWLAVGGTCGPTVVWGMGACGARMLAGVCAVSVVLVRAVSVSCLVDGVQARGQGPVLGGMSPGGLSRLVEQEFEELGLVRRGQGGCKLPVFVGAVCELFCCLGSGRPLHVRCRGPGVVRVGA